MKYFYISLLTVVWNLVQGKPICEYNRHLKISEDTNDCAFYYSCLNGRVIASHRCLGRKVWATKQQRCVHPIFADRPKCSCQNEYSRRCASINNTYL